MSAVSTKRFTNGDCFFSGTTPFCPVVDGLTNVEFISRDNISAYINGELVDNYGIEYKIRPNTNPPYSYNTTQNLTIVIDKNAEFIKQVRIQNMNNPFTQPIVENYNYTLIVWTAAGSEDPKQVSPYSILFSHKTDFFPFQNKPKRSGPEVIKLFSCSTQLSMKL